jgi:uncharacterized protein Yka (UPF0111/DUF47 family)
LKRKLKKKKEVEQYGRFLKMIDDLQTPEHKTNHKYRRVLPLCFKAKTTIKPKICMADCEIVIWISKLNSFPK